MSKKAKAAYKRILLKLSGEALLGKQPTGVDPDVVGYIADEIRSLAELKIQIGIVIGGGNIFRGTEACTRGMERTTADYMGMLATVINSLALQSALESKGLGEQAGGCFQSRLPGRLAGLGSRHAMPFAAQAAAPRMALLDDAVRMHEQLQAFKKRK